MVNKLEKDWYKEAVVYQIYPKSFCDSNGDGIGDIPGIISKLDYLSELGVNVIWLSPCYPSPQFDNGYDICDYRDIGKEFGTLKDFRELVALAHEKDIRVLMDLVVKSSSHLHPWFIESFKGRDNPYRDYYVWKDPVDGHEPNEWLSGFERSAWTFDEKSGQYFLHTFIDEEPDLNWENPTLRREIEDMINWWLDDVGIDGFRCDVINLVAKDYDALLPGDGTHLHEYLHELYTECLGPRNAVTVGEVYDLPPEKTLDLTAPEREELTLVFQFEHMRCGRDEGRRFFRKPFDKKRFVDVLANWQYGLEGKSWNALVLENHDQPRSINRFGDVNYRWQSATMLAALNFLQKGTVFIYQGEEIGQINPVFHNLEESIDCESKEIEPYLVKTFGMDETLAILSHDSRDCARVPMSWNNDKGYGFTTGTPWIKYNDFAGEINVDNEKASEYSVFVFYKKLISLKKSKETLKFGVFNLITNEDGLVEYTRTLEGSKTVKVILNYNDSSKDYAPSDNGDIILSNYHRDTLEDKMILNPYEAIVIEY